MPTFAGETLKERYQRELNQWNARLKKDDDAEGMRDFLIVVFIGGESIPFPPIKADWQGAATSAVLELFNPLPKGFNIICKEVKA